MTFFFWVVVGVGRETAPVLSVCHYGLSDAVCPGTFSSCGGKNTLTQSQVGIFIKTSWNPLHPGSEVKLTQNFHAPFSIFLTPTPHFNAFLIDRDM